MEISIDTIPIISITTLIQLTPTISARNKHNSPLSYSLQLLVAKLVSTNFLDYYCSNHFSDCFLHNFIIQSCKGSMKSQIGSSHQQKSFSKSSQISSPSFIKKINSIKQYLQAYQSNPQSADQWQLKQQTLIYHNQLKLSLHLIVSLIKICQSNQAQLKKISQQVGFLTKKILYLELKNHKRNQSAIKNQHSAGQLNQSANANTPIKRFNLAMQAQQMFMSSKKNPSTSEYKKIIDRKDQLLKNNMQENAFLRQEMLAMSVKVVQLQKQNQQLKKLNSNLQKENHLLNSKLKQNQHCKILNFSPISQKSQQHMDQEISFNHLTFADREDQCILLKSQKEQLQRQVHRLKKQNQGLQQKMMRYSRQDSEGLKKENEQLKKQMSAKLSQIQQYRELQSQIRYIEQYSLKYIAQNNYLKQQIKLLHLNYTQLQNKYNQCMECEKCIEYELQVQNLIQQLKKSNQKCSRLKSKIEKIVNTEQIQRKLWDQMYSVIEEKSF